MDFCPYCGKDLHTGTSYTNAPSSNVNSQDSYHTHNSNTRVSANLLSSFNLNNCITFIKNNPYIKWAIIVFMYVIFIITYTMTEGAIRTYSSGGGRYGYLTTDAFVFSLLVFALIFVAIWYIVNKLHPKAAKILKYILLYIVAVRVVFMLFGLTYGVMIALIFVLVSVYYSKMTKDD